MLEMSLAITVASLPGLKPLVHSDLAEETPIDVVEKEQKS
jgi:hypothetical protein